MQIYCLSAINEENQNSLGWLFSNFVVFDSSANYEQNVNFLGWLLSNFLVSDLSGSTVQHYIVCKISITRQLASVAEWLRHSTLNFRVPGSIPMENFFFFILIFQQLDLDIQGYFLLAINEPNLKFICWLISNLWHQIGQDQWLTVSLL